MLCLISIHCINISSPYPDWCNISLTPSAPNLGLVLYCKPATSSEPQEPRAQSWQILTLLTPILFFILCCHNTLLPWFTLGRWLGFGFITFEAEQSVDQAVNMHFHDIMGKKVCSCSFILPSRSNGGLGDRSGYIALSFYSSGCSFSSVHHSVRAFNKD